MKISVAGTGFASFICIKYLVGIGIKPIVFDLDNEISEENKIAIKSESIVKQKNYDKYICLGGLSNIWTGVIEKYSENDFLKWPINKNDLEPYYDDVLKFLNFAEVHSFYSSSNDDFLDYKIKKTNNLSKKEIYKDEKFSVQFASLLTNQLIDSEKNNLHYNNLVPFSISKEINKLIKDSKIDFRREKISKVSENANSVLIETLTKENQKKSFECDYLFVGCGTISTYQIMKNSFKNIEDNLRIKSSKKVVFPVKFLNIKNFEKKFFNTFPIAQIKGLDNKNFSIYSQIYNLNPNIINYIFPKLNNFKKYLFLFGLFKKFGFSYFGLGSDFSDEFTINNNNDVKIFEKKLKSSEIVSLCKNLFNKNFINNQILHLNIPFKMKPLSGNHFGAVFPMTKNKKKFFESDTFGRIGDLKKISINDSSIFSSLSSCPPTLTILANSLRITKEVVKNNFFGAPGRS